MIIDSSIRARYFGGISNDRQWIVVHYTANEGTKATAKGNANYFANCDRQASAHFIVDEGDTVYNCVAENKVAWAVGGNLYPNTKGGYYFNECTNYNSLSIEMVSHSNDLGYFIPEKTQENTIELIKYLQEKYGIDNDHVIRHYDVNGKPCPWCWTDVKPYCGEIVWSAFKARLNESDTVPAEQPEEKPEEKRDEKQNDILYRVQIGAFKNKAYAEEFIKEVKKKGYDAFITTVNGMYKIQVGAFRVKKYAEMFLQKLEDDELDGFIVAVQQDKKKVTDDLIQRIIKGEYGNGDLRKIRLEAEGYDYEEVRQAVNEWLGK